MLNNKLYYTSPAKEWHNALPLGNGRLGAMVYGEPLNETISLNEDSLWSGGFRKRENPDARDNIGLMRKLIREGRASEANKLCESAFYGNNDQQRHYQPLGDMHIVSEKTEISDYSHSLSLEYGVDEVKYTAGNVHFERRTFVSYPDDVIITMIRSDVKGSVSFEVSIDGRDDSYDENRAYDGNTLVYTISDGIPCTCVIHIVALGGRVTAHGSRLRADDADTAYIITAAQTAYRTGDHFYKAISQAKRAGRDPGGLYIRHIKDHNDLYSRCRLNIEGEDCDGIPTDKRLENIRNGGTDTGLAVLYFNFSKYLMIAGSRPGTLPLNLQGIWNKDMWPAWGCKYTVNINTEMNYWGAEVQSLSECHMPLFDHIERMREHGRVTARDMYGCGGAVCHHNTDIWGDTAPQDKWLPATLWVMGLAWLCIHIWEHFEYTQDLDFLNDRFDAMVEAAEFFLDYLVENEDGYLVVSPTLSPENTYITSEGEKGHLSEGCTMDTAILYTLFTDVIRAAKILWDEDYPDIIGRIKQTRDKLPPLKVGKHGQICEWMRDYDEAEPGHRHISQLFALYPGDMITPEKTPVLAEAARTTIERRLSHGGGHTGWSRAWIINMWARLYDGARVEENINALLAQSTADSMLDMHPPFQIDGNFGGGAGIAEALFQSTGGVMRFLPALPPSWESGKLSGFMARGGFRVAAFSWQDHKPGRAVIIPLAGNMCRIRSDKPIKVNGEIKEPVNGIVRFETEQGKLIMVDF
ncbi:MAG: glycoside hydrolase family 95 protein [Oscillospiraceae bacterium]|nr:glycoside hydrolase family 95 protein [Oscillospiraceae bacterium]